MSQMSFIILVLFGLMSSTTLASFNLHEGPLLSPITSFTLAIVTETTIKPSTCYVTSGEVTQCRRKRGIEEKPIQYNNGKWKIAPSAVIGIEATPLPRAINPLDYFNAHPVSSSLDDSFNKYYNVFQQLAIKGRKNVISVGDCGMSTVNFSEFIACLGMTVQETTTLTATFTETYTSISGYNSMTVAGCTPAGFPYKYCSETPDSTPSTDPAAP